MLRMKSMSLDFEEIRIAKNLRLPHQYAHSNIPKHRKLEGRVTKDVQEHHFINKAMILTTTS